MSEQELTAWDGFFAERGITPDAPHRKAVECFAAVHMQQLAALVKRAGAAEALGAAEKLGGFQAVRDFVCGGGLPGAVVDRYGVVVLDKRAHDVTHEGAA